MPKQTLAQKGNSSSKFLKTFAVAEGKVGKTTFIAASALGALPNQTKGLVSHPSHLHILGFDESFVDGLRDFLIKSCKVSEDYLSVDIRDLSELAKKAALDEQGWSFDLLNAVKREVGEVRAEIAKGGVHAILVSSLTGLGAGIKSSLAGAPKDGRKSSGMDENKWDALSNQLSFIRNMLQADTHHVFWEGHITKKTKTDSDGASKEKEETIGVQGSVGRNWGFNVAEIVRLRREAVKYPGFNVDKVFMDTRPSLDFVAGGRGFNEALAPREYDLAEFASKLGKTVGGYDGKTKAAAVAAPASGPVNAPAVSAG